MRILAFETSAKAASVAIVEDESLISESYQNTGLTHSQTILAMAESMMASCGLSPKDIDAVAVAGGPGSFTGVRIGVAAAKGFAWGRELPLYGVSTLEAMALSLGQHSGIVCAAMDARRNQVYNALFQGNNGKLLRLREDRAISLTELGEDLRAFSEDIFLVGDGALLCYNSLNGTIPRLHLAPEHRRHQRASGVGLAALELIRSGANGDAGTMQPNYLRLSQAERERAERLHRAEAGEIGGA